MKTSMKVLAGLTAAAAITAAITAAGLAIAGPRHGGAFAPGMSGLFALADKNADGAITRAEIEALRQQRFAARDANSDGRLTPEELDAAIAKRLERRKVRMRYRMLARLDANGDGVITREEFLSRPMRMFDRLDMNGDGRITREEMAKARKLRRNMGWRKARKHAPFAQ